MIFFPGHKNIPVSKYLRPLRCGEYTYSRPGHRVYSTARSFWYMTLARVDNAPCKKTGEFSLDLAEMRPVNVVTLLLCHLKRPGFIYVTKFNRTMLRCVKFKRTMISNVLTAKAISRAMLSSYLTRYIKNINSVATTLLQFRNGVVDFVTELSTSFV